MKGWRIKSMEHGFSAYLGMCDPREEDLDGLPFEWKLERSESTLFNSSYIARAYLAMARSLGNGNLTLVRVV